MSQQITQKELREAIAAKKRAEDLEKDPAIAAWRQAVQYSDGLWADLKKRAAAGFEKGTLALKVTFSSESRTVSWEKVVGELLKLAGVKKAVAADKDASAILDAAKEKNPAFPFVGTRGGGIASIDIERAPKA